MEDILKKLNLGTLIDFFQAERVDPTLLGACLMGTCVHSVIQQSAIVIESENCARNLCKTKTTVMALLVC